MNCKDLSAKHCIEYLSRLGVIRFTKDDVEILSVHTIGRDKGESMKATCRGCHHGRCICWVTGSCAGLQRHRLIYDYLKWALAAKHGDRDDHQRLGQALKKKWGMKVKG